MPFAPLKSTSTAATKPVLPANTPSLAYKKGSIINKRYAVRSKLSAGSYGTVLQAQDLRTDATVAIECSTAEVSHTESAILQRLRSKANGELANHPGRNHIIRYLDSFVIGEHGYLVLEHCILGDLYEAIISSRLPKDPEVIREIFIQLIHGIDFAHQAGVYHRDLKPENILLTTDLGGKLCVKISDFGLATTDEWSTEIGTGSDRYQAPEQYDENSEGYSPASADVWAAGITLLNMLFARNPWKVPSESDFVFADYKRNCLSLCDVFPTITAETFDVLSHAIALDPGKRDCQKLLKAVNELLNWTTDDEIPEIFSSDVGQTLTRPSSAVLGEREPLRTPSVAHSHLFVSENKDFSAASSVAKQNQTMHSTFSPTHNQEPLQQPLAEVPSAKSHESESRADSNLSSFNKDVGKRCHSKKEQSSYDSALGASLSALYITSNKSVPMDVPEYKDEDGGGKYNFLYKVSRSVPVKQSISRLKKEEFKFSASWSDMLEEEEVGDNFMGNEMKNVFQEPSNERLGLKLSKSSSSSSSAGATRESVYWDGVVVGHWEE